MWPVAYEGFGPFELGQVPYRLLQSDFRLSHNSHLGRPRPRALGQDAVLALAQSPFLLLHKPHRCAWAGLQRRSSQSFAKIPWKQTALPPLFVQCLSWVLGPHLPQPQSLIPCLLRRTSGSPEFAASASAANACNARSAAAFGRTWHRQRLHIGAHRAQERVDGAGASKPSPSAPSTRLRSVSRHLLLKTATTPADVSLH
jgi:hypothetical protein